MYGRKYFRPQAMAIFKTVGHKRVIKSARNFVIAISIQNLTPNLTFFCRNNGKQQNIFFLDLT
jgi:hypothetical protein